MDPTGSAQKEASEFVVGDDKSSPHDITLAASPVTGFEAAARSQDLEKSSTHGQLPQLPTWRLVTLCVSLCFGLFLSLLDTSIIATALFTIGVEFHATQSVNWVALAYTLSYVGFAVLTARISDVVGRRTAYVASFVIFVAFSIGCGFATSLNQLIIFRALQGIGGSGLYSLTMVIFPEMSPPKLRQWIASVVGMVVAISGILGPVLGGIITHSTTWRWVFWINAPIGIFAMTLFFVVWPKHNQMRHAERRSVKIIDVVGAILLIAASVLVVFSFQEGGIGANTDAWNQVIFLAPLIVGCFCWILLFGWEVVVSRMSSTMIPLLPIQLLRNRVYTGAVLCTVTTGFVYFVVIYSLPTYLQVVNQRSVIVAGVGLLPMLGSAAVGSMLGGLISGKRNNIFQVLLVAACFMTIGTGLLSTLSSFEMDNKVLGFQVLVGLGFGLTVSSVSMLAMLECDVKDNAVAQGIMAQARVLGGSIGIAASTAVLGVTERRELPNIPQADIASHTLTAAQHLQVRQAYADSFRETMHVTAIIACIGFVLTLFTYQRNPPRLADVKVS